MFTFQGCTLKYTEVRYCNIWGKRRGDGEVTSEWSPKRSVLTSSSWTTHWGLCLPGENQPQHIPVPAGLLLRCGGASLPWAGHSAQVPAPSALSDVRSMVWHMPGVGGSNPRLKTHDSSTDQGDLAGTHDAPSRCVEYCSEVNVVVTGPWDQTVKLWHPRTPCNAVTFCLWVTPSLFGDQLIVDKVGSKVLMWELQNTGYVQQCRVSNLTYQARCLWTFSYKQFCIKLSWRPSGSWVLAPKPWDTEEACLQVSKKIILSRFVLSMPFLLTTSTVRLLWVVLMDL